MMRCATLFGFSYSEKLTVLAIAVLFPVLALAIHSPNQNKQPPPIEKPPLLFWQAILPYGSENEAHPESRAFTEFEEVLSTVNALRAAMGSKTHNIDQWRQVREQVLLMPLQTLMAYDHPYFLAHSPDKKSVHLNGGWSQNGAYQFAISKQLPEFQRTAHLGDLSAILSIENGTLSNETAIVSLDAQVHFGTLLFSEMLHSMEAFHQQMEISNNAQTPPSTYYFDTQKSHPHIYDKLTTQERRLFSKLQQSTPNFTETLLQIIQIEALMDISDVKTGEVTPINITAKLDKESIKDNYKASWQQLKTLLKHVSFRTRLTTKQGQLAEIQYNAKTSTINIKANLSNGGIVLGCGENVVIIYPTQLESLTYFTTTDIHIDFYGLLIDLENLTLNSTYLAATPNDPDKQKASLDMTLNSPPIVRVKGALLYVLPSWLIDALIPGTIETLIVDVFNQVVQGNHGYGAHISLAFTESQGQHRLNANFNVEMPYSVIQDLLDTAIEKQKEDDAAIDKTKDKQIFDALRSSLRRDFDFYYRHYVQH